MAPHAFFQVFINITPPPHFFTKLNVGPHFLGFLFVPSPPLLYKTKDSPPPPPTLNLLPLLMYVECILLYCPYSLVLHNPGSPALAVAINHNYSGGSVGATWEINCHCTLASTGACSVPYKIQLPHLLTEFLLDARK